jgi:hypothetical protein
MNPNLVSAVLSNEDQQAVLAAIDTILGKMPFLIDLSTTDRMSMAKLGDKTKAFVGKAIEVATHNNEMFSAGFVQELQKDSTLLEVIGPIRVAVDALQKKIDDTTMQIGGEIFAAARTVYSVTKTPYGNAVLREVSNDLSQRFSRSKPSPAPAPPIPAPAPAPAASTQPAAAQPSQAKGASRKS